MKTFDEHLGEVVREVLDMNGIEIKGMCDDLWLSRASVYGHLKGKNRWPVEELVKIADYIDLPAGDLIEEAKRREGEEISSG